MKKLFVLAAITGVIAFGADRVWAQPSIYLNAQLAHALIGGAHDDTVALVLTAGMPMDDLIIKNLAFEVEVSKSLLDSERDGTSGGVKFRSDMSYYAVAAYGVYRFPVMERLDVYGRAGVAYVNMEFERRAGGSSSSDSDSDIEPTVGIGATYELTRRISAIAGITRLHSDIHHASAGIRFYF